MAPPATQQPATPTATQQPAAPTATQKPAASPPASSQQPAASPPAPGQPTTPGEETQRRAVAQALFDEAQKLLSNNEVHAACDKLEEVVRLQPGKIGAILALARCYEKEGKLGSAWTRYKNVADLARVSKDNRENEAQKKVDELDKKVPRLTIVLDAATAALPGLTVKRDGLEVTTVQWGVAIPADAGSHRIEVSAPGKKPWSSDATVSEGSAATVQVPALEAGPPEPVVTAQPTAPTAQPTVTARPDDGGSPGFLGLPGKTWGLVVGGVGVAGLIAGGVTGGLALGQHDELAKACPNGRCPAGKQGDVSSYETMGLISTIGFVAGGTLAAAGVAIFLFAPAQKPAASTAVTPYLTLGGAGVVGKF